MQVSKQQQQQGQRRNKKSWSAPKVNDIRAGAAELNVGANDDGVDAS